MNHIKRFNGTLRLTGRLLLALTGMLLLTAVVLARGEPARKGDATLESAPAAASYTLNWWSADGSGSRLSSGDYVLGGTAGQPDAAVWSNGDYVLTGGFWAGAGIEYSIYLPLLLRGHS